MSDDIFGKKDMSREIQMQVTERGFEPARVRVARDEATTLSVTRTTEGTLRTRARHEDARQLRHA